jgi:hypothetical protein
MKTTREKIEAGEFNSKVEYLERPKAPKGYKNTVENIIKQAPKGLELQALEKVGKEYLDYLQKLEDWKKAVDAWRKSENEGIRNFRKALEEENGLTNHPKADDLWIKAWDKGHSSGLSEVAWQYEDLLDLVI